MTSLSLSPVPLMAATVKDIVGISNSKKYRAINRYAFSVTGKSFHGTDEAPLRRSKKKKDNWTLVAELLKPVKKIRF